MTAFEIEVHDVAAGGDGIAHAPDGRVAFVRGGIPGDRLRVRVDEDKPRMVRASVDEVLVPSPDRVAAPCPNVGRGCGGCGWQHVEPEAQLRLKVRIAEESLRRIARLDGSVELGPALPTAGFRTTVRCLVTDGRAAFRAARTNEAVAVDSCLVAHPGIAELIASGRFGAVDEVTLRVGAATGERLALLTPSVPDGLSLPDDVLVVGDDDARDGTSTAFHDEVDGHRFRISPRSFFQTRTDGAAALVAAVRSMGDDCWDGGQLVDLYGGVGLFGVCLGEDMSVTVVEGSASSAADARHNLADRDAAVVRCSADRWRPAPADVVVADPPRAGLGAAVVERIVATGAERVVLVSCDPAAFARDTRLLTDAGYGRRRTMLVDLFPHTPHLELVSGFDVIRARP